MARQTWHMFTLFTIIFTILSFAGDVLTTTAAPWYENLPAVTMDYKVHIDAGKEDCYYQFVQPGATFYASYQVLKGGDGMCGFAVRHPNGQIVHPYEWRQSAEYADQTSSGGYYAICLDNQFSRFAGKLVNLYLSVIRYDMWEKYAKEVEELDMNIKNFTNSIQFVERNINDILQYQYHSRARESRDYNLLVDNNTYVLRPTNNNMSRSVNQTQKWHRANNSHTDSASKMNPPTFDLNKHQGQYYWSQVMQICTRWSLLQIIAVAATGTLQVYFLRKLFEVKDNSSKTRI